MLEREVQVASQIELTRMPRSRAGKWVRKQLPWSTTQVRADAIEMYGGTNENTALLLDGIYAELVATRAKDALVAYNRLVTVCKFAKDVYREKCYGNHVVPNECRRFLNEIPVFLYAIANENSSCVAERLLNALLNDELELQLVPIEFFGCLDRSRKKELLQLLALLEITDANRCRVCVLLTRALLSETDTVHLIAEANRMDLWERIEPDTIARRLVVEQRYVPQIQSLVTKALLNERIEGNQAELLSLTLSVCDAEGDSETARSVLFELFQATLGITFAREWLRRLPEGEEHPAAECKILEYVSSHSLRGRALLFLIGWSDLLRAEKHALTYASVMDDVDRWQLEQASAKLANVAPEAALKLLQKACDWPEALREHLVYFFPMATPKWHASWPEDACLTQGQSSMINFSQQRSLFAKVNLVPRETP
jgi:hypothetical protein